MSFGWEQSARTVTVTFAGPPDLRPSDVLVALTDTTVSAGVRGRAPSCEGLLHAAVMPGTLVWGVRRLARASAVVAAVQKAAPALWPAFFSSPQTGPPATRRVRAVYAYEAQGPSELQMAKGDVVVVGAVDTGTGWWHGKREADARTGWFPSNFVEEFAPDWPDLPPPGPDDPEMEVPKVENGASVRAWCSHEGAEPGELAFSAGDEIVVTRQEDSGWWLGECNGKSGWFPANFVKAIHPCPEPSAPPEPAAAAAAAAADRPMSPKSPPMAIVSCKAAATASPPVASSLSKSSSPAHNPFLLQAMGTPVSGSPLKVAASPAIQAPPSPAPQPPSTPAPPEPSGAFEPPPIPDMPAPTPPECPSEPAPAPEAPKAPAPVLEEQRPAPAAPAPVQAAAPVLCEVPASAPAPQRSPVSPSGSGSGSALKTSREAGSPGKAAATGQDHKALPAAPTAAAVAATARREAGHSQPVASAASPIVMDPRPVSSTTAMAPVYSPSPPAQASSSGEDEQKTTPTKRGALWNVLHKAALSTSGKHKQQSSQHVTASTKTNSGTELKHSHSASTSRRSSSESNLKVLPPGPAHAAAASSSSLSSSEPAAPPPPYQPQPQSQPQGQQGQQPRQAADAERYDTEARSKLCLVYTASDFEVPQQGSYVQSVATFRTRLRGCPGVVVSVRAVDQEVGVMARPGGTMERHRREWDALRLLSHHDAVLRPYCSFIDKLPEEWNAAVPSDQPCYQLRNESLIFSVWPGDLVDVNAAAAETGMNEDRAAQWLRQLMAALEHLRHYRLVHRNIHCAAIVVDPRNKDCVKLRDFGYSIVCGDDTLGWSGDGRGGSVWGPYSPLPPELDEAQGSGPAGGRVSYLAADVYSAAVTLWYALSSSASPSPSPRGSGASTVAPMMPRLSHKVHALEPVLHTLLNRSPEARLAAARALLQK
eukprot:m51a1_g2053 hypothetical protein (934) ;mRNA; r:1398577-1402140